MLAYFISDNTLVVEAMLWDHCGPTTLNKYYTIIHKCTLYIFFLLNHTHYLKALKEGHI